jgi:hypothetical protein
MGGTKGRSHWRSYPRDACGPGGIGINSNLFSCYIPGAYFPYVGLNICLIYKVKCLNDLQILLTATKKHFPE